MFVRGLRPHMDCKSEAQAETMPGLQLKEVVGITSPDTKGRAACDIPGRQSALRRNDREETPKGETSKGEKQAGKMRGKVTART